jgi:hypothetical protein
MACAAMDPVKIRSFEGTFIITGDPNNIQLQGVSAGERHLRFDRPDMTGDIGSHSIHQLLHRVSYLPEGQYAPAPLQSAILQFKAILYAHTRSVVIQWHEIRPEELRHQFRALCQWTQTHQTFWIYCEILSKLLGQVTTTRAVKVTMEEACP